MAKKSRATGKRRCGQGIIKHLVSKHMQFECTRGTRGGPAGVAIKVSIQGQGESPCPICTVQSVSICPRYPC